MMDDTLADESGIPFLCSNDDIPVHSTPIKGAKVPLPSTKHVLKRMVQKTRQPQDLTQDFTASESIQAIQLSDTQTLSRDTALHQFHRDQGQPRGQGHQSKKAFSVDRDGHFHHVQRNSNHYRFKQEHDINHMYQKDNLRPKSKDNVNSHDNVALGSIRSETHPQALKPNKTPANMYDSSSPQNTDRLTKNHQREAETNGESQKQQKHKEITESGYSYQADLVSAKDNRTIAKDHQLSLSDSNNSAYSSYANSNKQWSRQSAYQYSTDRPVVTTERPSTQESKVRVETLTRISREFPDESINVERKRVTISSPDMSRNQRYLSNKSSTAAKQNASFCELENSTLQKQRQEIQLLMSELKDRDRELSDMVAAHQQQLVAWEQDRHRLTTTEKKCTQYEEELQIKSSQLHHTISSLKMLKARECELRRELQDTRSTLDILRDENQGLQGDLEQEKTKGQQFQEKLQSVSETVGRLEAREEELATNLKLKERDIASATGQMKDLSGRLTQLDLRCKECQDREKEAVREKDDWKQKHDRSELERKSVSDELANSRAEIFRLTEEKRSARQQLALVQKEMGMREKCKDELIESLKIKQERTDSQLRNIRELYERQLKEVAQLQQQLDTSKEIIQRQQNSLDEQQLSGSYQNRRSSGMSDYSLEKSAASQRSNQSSKVKHSPVHSAKYREPEYYIQSSNHQSSGYQSQISENQTARTKHSPVHSTKYREPDYDQSSNHQSSGYQSQLSENQTGTILGNQQLNLHNVSDQQTVTSLKQARFLSRTAGKTDEALKFKVSSQSGSVAKNIHFSIERSPKENIKKRIDYSEFTSSDTFASNKSVSQNQNAEESLKSEKASLPNNTAGETLPSLSEKSGPQLQSPPRHEGFVIQQTHIEQTEPRDSRPAPAPRETSRGPVEERREVITHKQREVTDTDTSLSRQDREDCDREMVQKFMFENKLRSFLEDLDDIDDSIWEDKPNRSINISTTEGSPASKLQKLLLESRLMIQNLEKSAESPTTTTTHNNSSSPRQKTEKTETELPAKPET